jgi:hypothetical protein
MDEKFEVTMRKCNGMGAIRRAALDIMQAAKDSLMNVATMSGEEANTIVPEKLSVDLANVATIDGGVDMNITIQQQSVMVDVNAATMGGEEGNNIAQEQPSVDPINATSMGGGVEINITNEQPP